MTKTTQNQAVKKTAWNQGAKKTTQNQLATNTSLKKTVIKMGMVILFFFCPKVEIPSSDIKSEDEASGTALDKVDQETF